MRYYVNADGTEIIFNEDYFRKHRGVRPVAGPFEERKGEIVFCSMSAKKLDNKPDTRYK